MALHSVRRLGPPLLREAALVLLVCLAMGGPLAGCKSIDKAAEQQTPHLIIMMGRSQRMPLMDVGERAPPALRRGKKRTG